MKNYEYKMVVPVDSNGEPCYSLHADHFEDIADHPYPTAYNKAVFGVYCRDNGASPAHHIADCVNEVSAKRIVELLNSKYETL